MIYENGVEVGRTLINKSNYIPAPRYITVGTKEVETVPNIPEGSDIEDDANNEQKVGSNLEDNKKINIQEDNLTILMSKSRGHLLGFRMG